MATDALRSPPPPPEDKCNRMTQMAGQKAIKFGRNLAGKKAVITRAIVDRWHKRKGRKVKPFEHNISSEAFECYCSDFKENCNENIRIAENEKLDTSFKIETSGDFNETAEKIQLSYTALLSPLSELNIDELYEEVLHEILHCVGVNKSNCFNQTNLIAFAQKAFNIERETHDAIYRSVREKDAPNKILNVEIVEGNFKPKDANGSSDPFCTLFLSSNPQHKLNTSFKSQTLRPVWSEHFSLPVEDPANDVLHVEVWDFDPVETIKEKVTKANKVKGIKGMRKILKEIVVTATYGKHDSEIIGTTLIPLKTITSRCHKAWHTLESKGKRHGDLLVNLSFGVETSKEVSVQEHRHLLRVLLAHQINEQKVEIHSWTGDFLPESRLIIQQNVAHRNISHVDEHLSQWIEYINAHLLCPTISPKVFSDVMDNLTKPITTGQLSSHELEMFWQSAKRILPFCYDIIRTIRKKPPADERLLDQIGHVLNTLGQLQSLDVPNDLDLFTSDIYGWLLPCEFPRTVRSTLHDAVVQGAVDWHVSVLQNNKPRDFTQDGEIKLKLKIIRLFKQDLQNAIEFHNRLFVEKTRFPYAGILFSIYDSKISEMCDPFVAQVCANMRPIDFRENGEFDAETGCDSLALGTSLFELYVEIKKFAELGHDCNGDVDLGTGDHSIKYRLWFQKAVARWLDIAAYKAMKRIDKAVELDKLVEIDTSAEISTSAVDTLTIFYEIKAFWQQLAWPDVECSYSFMAKIIDDIRKCSLHYSDKMTHKVVTSTVLEHGRFVVTKEWCLAVNDIDHIKRSISPFVNDLGPTELMDNLACYKGVADADRCKKTLELIVDNAIDTVNNKIVDLIQVIVNHMRPEIRKLLSQGVETVNTKNTHLENLKQYLDESLCTLSNELNEEYFKLALDLIIEQIVTLTFDLIHTNVEKKKPPTYFRNLRDSFHKLLGFLRNGNETAEYMYETMQTLESLLYLHASDTVDLIHEYYLERLQEQKESVQDANEGVLTVKLIFINDALKIEILSAHRIRPVDSNGFSNPFVKVRLVPQNKFQNVVKPKTAVQKKTLSPLFDECFKISLTPEQRAEENGIVMFKIEDRDFMGVANEFISEAFVHFKDIASTRLENDIHNLPQLKLNMTVPKSLDSKILNVLEGRSTDKLAKDFMKKLKAKIAASNLTPKK